MFAFFKSKKRQSTRIQQFTDVERSVIFESLQQSKIEYTKQSHNRTTARKLDTIQKLLDELRIFVR